MIQRHLKTASIKFQDFFKEISGMCVLSMFTGGSFVFEASIKDVLKKTQECF